MRIVFLMVAIVLSSIRTYCQNTLQEKLFLPVELEQDINYLFTKLEEIHPNLYAHTSKTDIDKLIQKTKAEINNPMTRKEFSLKLIPIVTSFNDAHTSLSLPIEERTDYLKNGGRIFPFEVKISDNRLFVKINYLSNSEIEINSEILAINGDPCSKILAEMRKYVSAELELYRDIRIESDFRRLLWFIYGIGNNITLSISQNGLTNEKKIEGISLKDFENKIAIQNASATSRSFSFYQLDGNIGVIDFRQMVLKKEFKNFLDSVFTVVKYNNINNLIIDIRRNGGGNSQLGEMLFNYITDNPYKMAEQMDIKVSRETKKYFRKQFLKWYLAPIIYPFALFYPQARPYLYGKNGKTKTIIQNKMQKPKKEKLKFQGKTFLLTSNYTFSSANMLAATFKCYQMGTIIGEGTGGLLTSYGDVIRFQLPNTNLYANSSHKKFVLPCSDNIAHGVEPDFEIKPTIEEIMNGRDAAIEYVKSIIK